MRSRPCVSYRKRSATAGPSFIMDSEEEAALLVLLLCRRRRRRRLKRQRSWWMHPVTSGRLTDGHFYTRMKNLKADNVEFTSFFSMSLDCFNHLLTLIKPHIQRTDTNMRRSIPAEERLAITLRLVAVSLCIRTIFCLNSRVCVCFLVAPLDN